MSEPNVDNTPWWLEMQTAEDYKHAKHLLGDETILGFVLDVLTLFDEWTGADKDYLSWRTDAEYAPITFLINCNDVFWWGTSDCEQLNPDGYLTFHQALVDCNAVSREAGILYATTLYCARRRKLRPQGAWYRDVNPEIAELFDACGPERKVEIGNPYPRYPEQKMKPNTWDDVRKQFFEYLHTPERFADDGVEPPNPDAVNQLRYIVNLCSQYYPIYPVPDILVRCVNGEVALRWRLSGRDFLNYEAGNDGNDLTVWTNDRITERVTGHSVTLVPNDHTLRETLCDALTAKDVEKVLDVVQLANRR